MKQLILQIQAWYLRNYYYAGKTFWYCDCSQPTLLQTFSYPDGRTVIYLGNNTAAYV